MPRRSTFRPGDWWVLWNTRFSSAVVKAVGRAVVVGDAAAVGLEVERGPGGRCVTRQTRAVIPPSHTIRFATGCGMPQKSASFFVVSPR